jgi:hypothetical protein
MAECRVSCFLPPFRLSILGVRSGVSAYLIQQAASDEGIGARWFGHPPGLCKVESRPNKGRGLPLPLSCPALARQWPEWEIQGPNVDFVQVWGNKRKGPSPPSPRGYFHCPTHTHLNLSSFRITSHRISAHHVCHHDRDAVGADHGRHDPPSFPRHRHKRGGPRRPRRGADPLDGRGLHCHGRE